MRKDNFQLFITLRILESGIVMKLHVSEYIYHYLNCEDLEFTAKGPKCEPSWEKGFQKLQVLRGYSDYEESELQSEVETAKQINKTRILERGRCAILGEEGW